MNQVREVERRTRGDQQGSGVLIFGPDDIGKKLLPFLLMEFITPESGIADRSQGPPPGVMAFCYQPEPHPENPLQGGLEWRRGGSQGLQEVGVMQGTPEFRLWLAASPVPPGQVPDCGRLPLLAIPKIDRIRVLLGVHRGLRSPIRSDRQLNCFDITLASDERWDYEPAPGHNIAWLFPYQGALQVGNHRYLRELIIFKSTAGRLSLRAEGAGAKILMGTAMKVNTSLLDPLRSPWG